jgi:hypothetical protein
MRERVMREGVKGSEGNSIVIKKRKGKQGEVVGGRKKRECTVVVINI